MQMNVNGRDDQPPPRPDVVEIADRVRAVSLELTEVRDRQAESEAAYRRALGSEEGDLKRGQEKERDRYRARLDAAGERGFQERRRLKARREDRKKRIIETVQRMREALSEALQAERRRTDAEFAAVRDRLTDEARREREPRGRRLTRWAELRTEVQAEHENTEAVLARIAERHGVAVLEPGIVSVAIDPDATADKLANETEASFRVIRAETKRAAHWWAAGLTRTGRFLFYQVLLIIVGFGSAGVAIRAGVEPPRVAPLLAGLTAVTLLLYLASRLARGRQRRVISSLYERTWTVARRYERHAEAAQMDLDTLFAKSAEEHSRRLQKEESRLRSEGLARSAPVRQRLNALDERAARAAGKIVARHAAQVESLDLKEAEERRAIKAEYEESLGRERASKQDRLKDAEAANERVSAESRIRRATALAEFTRFTTALTEDADRRHRNWKMIDPLGLELPGQFPGYVPLGRLRVTMDGLLGPEAEDDSASREIELPVAATFPEHGSLLVQHTPEDRPRALAILVNAVLRTLSAFPPGKVRLTLLDPVGLGQSFSALMHLADHDEDLVSGRIWTETRHFESRLADLTEHIEKVIQKYLRNKYNSIAEYNEEAGELQEPYHFLVIADFPAAMNELSAERLASIVSSGPRCGVYTLIAHDIRSPVPPPVDLGLLTRNGPALRFQEGICRLIGDRLEQGEFLPELPPPPEMTAALLDRVGRLSVEAAHIELPFSAITPNDEETWSARADKGIRVPVGRTGAERLQYLDLGRGTAQHALIAGRTGSGKSTLFHVMITNMSLWFPPEEIEFYLIDFKKGVEFKPYATEALPHARVVAIESDREFGLSVLRAIDEELGRRGDLFRGVGAQDLAAFRRSAPDVDMPRALLMIDEFQEFFTDDDAVAHNAALMLDRFVRQGRAFGIHVVLGSQTLSGIYTLARGTLGQMGVRIALQCNESDSYLILSEDNGVARLLNRPGEAIYNDKSGLVEGNNPFQVVWVSEAEQRASLKALAKRAAAHPPAVPRPLVVFEGNQPAEIEANPELMEIVASGERKSEGDDRAWLGEPNAIKGHTEVRFLPASGSNLLVVGQRREAAFAMMASSILSLAAQHEPNDLKVFILDGGGHEPEYTGHFENLITAVPHKVGRYDLRTAADAVKVVSEILIAREEGAEDRAPVYVFAFGLQRLRMLRREDEFASPFGDDQPESSGELFATILTDGPPQNIHTLIWCDTVPNLQRTLSRKALREFDVRVLFQMSAADSSELIESSAANRLGLTNALLAMESQGTFEKFRPYAIPDGALMRKIGRLQG